jgi:hypothetical protein
MRRDHIDDGAGVETERRMFTGSVRMPAELLQLSQAKLGVFRHLADMFNDIHSDGRRHGAVGDHNESGRKKKRSEQHW